MTPDGGGAEAALARARAAQAAASDPAASAFVPASAGSGKTKLLVDRVLRLIMSGVDPGRILCLTFTTAAASEMDTRLRNRLAGWAIADQQTLLGWLDELGVARQQAERARTLFATVLDHPGGLRIQNFHSFCQSVLRRFPLEAAISPQFRLLETMDADIHRSGARALAVAGSAPAALDLPSAYARDPDDLAAKLHEFEGAAMAGDHPTLVAAIRLALGLRHADESSLMGDAVAWPQETAVADTIREVARIRSGTKKSSTKATDQKLAWLSRAAADRVTTWVEWHRSFLRADGGPFDLGTLLGKDAFAISAIVTAYEQEALRVRSVCDARKALRLADISAAMLALAHPARTRYTQTKQATGGLDFDDLIALSGKLLHDPGAAWVLFKLDGGLDHLLLDEVQDTSPAQWRIAHALADEFFIPGSARAGTRRTAFAVGDKKQSIFGFQGADVAAFDGNRGRWADAITASGGTLADANLDVSFRSAPPILSLVDAVFAQGSPWNEGVGNTGHVALRAGHAGAVTWWPLEPKPVRETVPGFTSVQAAAKSGDQTASLADRVARWVRDRVDMPGGAVHPGDVLILLRKRVPLMGPLVAALKRQGVPVAGADRFALLDQIGVRDLLALCDVLLLPEDDLSLACVLRSPLCAVDEASLYDLAHSRLAGRLLWDALRARAAERPEWRSALCLLDHLRGLTDRLGPHALLTEALRWNGGRAALFARLSAEAAEGLDELLNLALTYERAHPCSLRGFVAWVRASGAVVKREAEAAGDAVRIMTVHGAKGLQARVVILPDTTRAEAAAKQPVVHVDGMPVWVAHADLATDAIKALVAARKQAAREETNRLLYVALTRAEDEVLVCGWAPGGSSEDESKPKPAKPSWHSAIGDALGVLGATPFQSPVGTGLRLEHHGVTVATTPRRNAGGAALPSWSGRPGAWVPVPPLALPPRPAPLAPSRPEGATFGTVPAGTSPLLDGVDRFARGTLIHTMLQHLPAIPAAGRLAAAAAYASRSGTDAATAAEVMAILHHPALEGLFGPGSRAEVPVTGLIGDRVVGGVIDRLLVAPDKVLIADYKTNARPPADVCATPASYVAQLAAYRGLLRQIYPGRTVSCVLIWTRTATVTPMPDAMLDAAAAAFA